MDMMEIRRRVLMGSRKKDYLKSVEWIEGKFIGAGGGIGTSPSLKYTESIHLPADTYVFAGTMKSQSPVTTRIHAYDANDKRIRQLIAPGISPNSSFSVEITVPNDVYAIRISTGITVEATLTKV